MYYCKIIHHLQLIRTKLTTRGRLVGLDTVPDTRVPSLQGDNSPDNVTFPDNSMTFPWRFAALLSMLSVTHIMPVLVLLSVVGGKNATVHDSKPKWNAQTQQSQEWMLICSYDSFRPLFPDKIFPSLPWLLVKSLTFPSQLSKSMTFPGVQWSRWVSWESKKKYRSSNLKEV